ncbi:hypothetical protein [Tenuibacillus multivorans]|uniref:Uncharacterized protein n=1 Tax=Tenuibacillus multivorans TaxID=237069 RepID=A0A1G9YG06_9BACI|nr:hypothetical protein [Tenuibacillus multivorans]GEL76066.1 hypothetical protein TMU01_03010 [Tenuibacillus multivorans]SDN07413.1 hypothetical protein SAMN05216498_1362 [Tenuibacillus multivorans]
MKRKVNFISQVLAAGFLTLMIVIDFFPNIGIDMSIGVVGIVTFTALAGITHRKGEPVFKSSKQEFIFTFLSGIYFFSLLLILSLLGGVSQKGIVFTNPVLWVLFLFALIVSYTKYKKQLKQTGNRGRETFQ